MFYFSMKLIFLLFINFLNNKMYDSVLLIKFANGQSVRKVWKPREASSLQFYFTAYFSIPTAFLMAYLLTKQHVQERRQLSIETRL
jgi:ABC-type Fe3+ transport system permease subunit